MKISRIFKWLKGLSREDWAKNLCLKVLEKMPDEYLVYIEELKSGIIGHVLTDFRSIPYRYNFFFNTSVSERFEKRSEPYFNLKGFVLSNACEKNIDLSIYFARGLIAGISFSAEEKFNLTDLQVDINNVQKTLIVEQLSQSFWDEFQVIHSKYPEINISEIYQVNLDGRCIYHLLDIDDGDFVGYEISKGFVKVCHDDLETISNIPNLDEYFL